MRELLRVMRANPGVARAAIGQVPLGERALLSTERILGILKAGNLPDQAAAWAVDLIPLYVTAIAFEESVQGAAGWTEATSKASSPASATSSPPSPPTATP